MVELSKANQAKVNSLKQQNRVLDAELKASEQARQNAMASFRRGEINAKKLRNQENQTGKTRDRIIAAKGRISRQISDIEIRALGGDPTARQPKAVFKTKQEIAFQRGQLKIKPADVLREQKAAAEEGRRAKTRQELTAELEAKKKIDIEALKQSERERLIKETTELLERKAAKGKQRVLTQREADEIVKIVTKKDRVITRRELDETLGMLQKRLVLPKPLSEQIGEMFPPPRPQPFQETITIPPPEIFPIDVRARTEEIGERFPPERFEGFQETAQLPFDDFQRFINQDLVTPVEAFPKPREQVITQPVTEPGTIFTIKRRAEKLRKKQKELERKAKAEPVTQLVATPLAISLLAEAKATGRRAAILESIVTRKKLEEKGAVAIESAALTFLLGGLKAPPPVTKGIVAAFGIAEAFRIKEIKKEVDPFKRERDLANEELNILAAIGGGVTGGLIGAKAFPPTKAVVTKPKGKDVLLTETFEAGEIVQKIGFEKFIKKDVTLRTDVEAFTRRVTPPKDVEALVDFISRPDIRPEFRVTEKGLERVLVQDVPGKVRVFKPEVTPFEFKGKALAEVTLKKGEVEIVKRTEKPFGIERDIDVTEFDFAEVGKELILTKKIKAKPPSELITEAKLGAVGRISTLLKKAKGKVSDVLSLGLDLPTQDILLKTAKGKPLLSLEPISKARFGLIPPTEVKKEIKEPILKIGEEMIIKPIIKPIGKTAIEEAVDIIKKFKPKVKEEIKPKQVTDVIVDVTEEPKPVTEPILIVEQKAEEVSVIDIVGRGIAEEELVSVSIPPPTALGLLLFPPGITREERKKKKFDSYDVTAREKGKDVKLNPKPLTREAAFDLGSEVVDSTLSARFRVRQRKKKLSKPPLDRVTRYFNQNIFKFRDHTSDKFGRPTGQLPKGERIEKRQFRLDKKSEVREISIAKFLAQRKKSFVGEKGQQQIADNLLFGKQKKEKRGKRKKGLLEF